MTPRIQGQIGYCVCKPSFAVSARRRSRLQRPVNIPSDARHTGKDCASDANRHTWRKAAAQKALAIARSLSPSNRTMGICNGPVCLSAKPWGWPLHEAIPKTLPHGCVCASASVVRRISIVLSAAAMEAAPYQNEPSQRFSKRHPACGTAGNSRQRPAIGNRFRIGGKVRRTQ